MFRSPLGRSLAVRVRAARRLVLVAGLFIVAASVPFINAGAWQQEDGQPRKPRATAKGQANVIEGAEFVPGEVLVRFRSDAAAKSAEAAPASLRAEDGGDVTFRRFEGSDIVDDLRLATVDPARTLDAVSELASRPDVLYAEPNYIWRTQRTPNDPFFPQMYGLTRINAPTAWNTTIGSRNIVVGVLDGGVDTNHEDLRDNLWTNTGEVPNNNIDDDSNGFIDDVNGWDFAHNDKTIFDNEDGDDHATHVAGTIGAEGDNALGVTGVNWEVSLMALKVLGPDGGNVANIIKGYNYVLQMRQRGVNIRVLNNSYGGPGKSLAALDAIQQLNNAGILFVVAAGNGGGDSIGDDNFSFPDYPASYDAPNVLAVASTNSSDGMSDFSNFSSRLVSMGAPGSAIASTVPVSQFPSGYAFFSGTSMASPHVAGAAALVLSVRPDIPLANLRGVLAFTGDRVNSLDGKTTTGRRLNAANAISSALEGDATPPASAVNLRVTGQAGRNITLAWTAPGDDNMTGTAADYDLFFVNPTTGARTLLPTSLVPAAAGSAQAVAVNAPFRNFSGTIQLRAYDNVGNSSTASVGITVPVNSGSDPYTVALSAAQPLTSGGTNLFPAGGDDKYTPYTLPTPFTFPFYGAVRKSMVVSTNGVLYFSDPPRRENDDADDAGSSSEGMQGQSMIAGLWDDIDLRTCMRSDSGVYVSQPDANRLVFRWQGVPFSLDNCPATPLSTSTHVNFEIELRTDGVILMRYGQNAGLFSVVGISGGEPDAYVVASHTSESVRKNLTNAQTVTFSPRSAVLRTISGRVTSDGSNGLGGVTLALSGAVTATVESAADGSYSFPNLPEVGNYTVTPSRTNYTFSPPSISFVNLNADQTSVNFTGTVITYTISGRVTEAGNVPLPGVTITLSGPQTGTTTTDAQGNYSFPNLVVGGIYTVTASKANYSLSSPQTFPLNSNQTANFTATLRRHTIGGNVRDVNGGVPGVLITLSGTASLTTTTDAQGNYGFMGGGVHGGTYIITASKQNYTFTPSSYTIASLSGDQTVDFSSGLVTYSISGVIRDANGTGLAGINVGLSGGPSPGVATTDANGSYIFPNVIAGNNYTVTPSGGFNIYTPQSHLLPNLSANQAGVNFTAVPEPVVLQFAQSSYIYGEGASTASIFVTRTGNPGGSVSVDLVTVDDTAAVPCDPTVRQPDGTLYPQGTAFARCDYATTIERVTFAAGDTTSKEIFIPLVNDVHVEQTETFQLKLQNASNATIGERATTTFSLLDDDIAGKQNPINQTPFFVRMQYLDFLSREPEPNEPWSAVLNNCPDVFNNSACDRPTVSKSFFRSQEFQLKGSFVYRFYGLAFGRLPLYTEIVADMRSVTGATENEVYQKKDAFAKNWVQRPAFVAEFGSLTASGFVNKLMDRYGLQTITTLDPANPDKGAKLTYTRAALIDGLTFTTLTQAQVVRAIADSDEVFLAEYNRAFVAMQYFGYLRRDPDASGFNAWLNYLNANPTDDRTMVRGFVNSREYQSRFGPAQ